MRMNYPKFREVKTWDTTTNIKWRNYTLHLEYETEPPFGDFIYSVTLLFDNDTIVPPFWIYGRSILFCDNVVVVQAVETGSYRGLHSIIIDTDARKFIKLDDLYNKYIAENDLLVLVDTFKNKQLTVNDELFLKDAMPL